MGDSLPPAAAVAILVLVSSQTGFSVHFRYVLPMFPFVFVWISRVAELNRRWRIAALGTVLLSIASSLSVWPHGLSYFNELAGGPKNGHAHLLGSSLDWGQDLLYLSEWIAQHPEAHGMKGACVGPTPPELVGLEAGSPPHLRRRDDGSIDPESGPQPGWHAVSVNLLRETRYEYFLEFQPVAIAGYSIYIYHLEPAAVDAWRIRHADP
jgi:hypothetical protein